MDDSIINLQHWREIKGQILNAWRGSTDEEIDKLYEYENKAS